MEYSDFSEFVGNKTKKPDTGIGDSTCLFLGCFAGQHVRARRCTVQTSYELISLNAVQVVFRRRVTRSQFFDTIRGLFKTFYGFYPGRISFEVIFQDFVSQRLSNKTSPVQILPVFRRSCEVPAIPPNDGNML